MKGKKLGVVQLGISGFPYGNRAAVNKILAMFKGLHESNVNAVVVNKKGIYEKNGQATYDSQGNYEGIDFYTATGNAYRPSGFIDRNLRKIYGLLNEIRLLFKLKREKKLDAAIVDTMFFSDILLYRLLSKVLNFSLIYHYVEMRSQIHDPKKTTRRKISNYLTDKYVANLFDGILPISDLLENAVKEIAPQKPMHKVPVLCDYTKFQIAKSENRDTYFLYCGSASYAEVIYFILEAFEGIPSKDVYLYLIISGSKEKKKAVYDTIDASPKKHLIKTFSNIPYEELVEKYVNALGLLIPLRPTIQDAARFPFKVSEYLATGNPVITTAYGELKHYFKDKYNGFVADEFDVALYREKMLYVLENPEESKKVGMKGQEMGFKNFHYSQQGDKIKEFIESIQNNA